MFADGIDNLDDYIEAHRPMKQEPISKEKEEMLSMLSGRGSAVSRVLGDEVKFKDGFDTHIIKVESIVRKGNKGVVGGHNLDNFMKVFKDNGWDIDECILITKKHPFIEGIFEIKYGIPKLDREGIIIPGELKVVHQPKTVYDPSIISDEDLIEWGKDAMRNCTINNRNIDGISSNGLRFRGYLNEETGEITNFFPKID